METKNLLTYSIEEISAEELFRLQLAIDNELGRRRFRAKEIAWDKMVDSIKDYITAFGSIEFHIFGEEYYINNTDDFSTIGEILSQD